MEKLKEVKCLYNTDKYTVIKLKTNYDVYIVKFPYHEVESQKGNRYAYSLGIKKYCQIHDIDVVEYLNIIHRDAR